MKVCWCSGNKNTLMTFMAAEKEKKKRRRGRMRRRSLITMPVGAGHP